MKTHLSLLPALLSATGLVGCANLQSTWDHTRSGAQSLANSALQAAGFNRFDLQGHRGARGHAPENTLPAFTKALAQGVTTLELDVGLTADNVLVIYHDRTLNPAITRDATGNFLKGRGPAIRSLSWAQLQTYDLSGLDRASDYAKGFPDQQSIPGTRMLRLVDLFEFMARIGDHTTRFNIETKLSPFAPTETADPETFGRALIGEIRKANLTRRATVQSFDWRTLQIVQKEAPDIATVHLTSEQPNFDNIKTGAWTAGFEAKNFASTAHLVKAAGGRVWSPTFRDLTHDKVRGAQSLGVKVIPWTVNETADIERMLDWGVSGLISDYPDRVTTALKARKVRW